MQNPRKEGETLLKEGKYSDALTLFLSIPEHEKDAQLCANIGHCYFKQKRFKLAIQHLTKMQKFYQKRTTGKMECSGIFSKRQTKKSYRNH